MQHPTLRSLAVASLLTLAGNALAHGGQYRGPKDIVPPGTPSHRGNTGQPAPPTTPRPSSPTAPRPPGPTTPRPTPPGAPPTGGPPGTPRRGPQTPRGIDLGPDLSMWQFWWEFNKHPFINLKDAIHAPAPTTGSDEFYLGQRRHVASASTMKPSESDIKETILPSLKRALDATDDRDIVSSCLVAMAKIGMDHSRFELLPVFASFLKRRDQEVRETAALAMGISAIPAAVAPLTELATDSERGRAMCDRSQVDPRTRSFACYGLGLVAHRSADLDLKRSCFTVLEKILGDPRIRNRNLKVAAIHGISLLNLRREGLDTKELALRDEALAALDAYAEHRAGTGTDLIKAHVPTAVARLIGRGTSRRHEAYKERYRRLLATRGGPKRGNDIYRSAALALGQLCLPEEEHGADRGYSKALLDYYHTGRDQQTRYFCLIALGQIGGDVNKGILLTALRKGQKSLERPWAALALGVLNFHRLAADSKATLGGLVRDQLRRQLGEIKDPAALAAVALALGLSRMKETAGDLLELLQKHHAKDELAGYLCVGLALMNEPRAKDPIHRIVEQSVRRPELLRQAAVALGKLGDKSVTRTLIGMLQEEEPNLAKLSAIASALSYIGDRRTIKPLLKMLFDDSITPLSRAFAAVALGGVADKEKLPWNSKISRDINYRAAVETLTQSGTGVLDIL